jgi:predicted dehydrogenase
MDQVVHTYGVPQRITGIVAQQREGAQVDDTATILLHYNKAGPEGMPLMATVKAAVVSAEVEQLRFWVRGTKGSFKKFGLDVQEGQLRKGMKPWQEGFGVESESSHGTLTEWDGKDVKSRTVETVKPETYTRYYELLAEALQGKGSVPVSADEAADVIKLVELAKQSSDEGRTLDV